MSSKSAIRNYHWIIGILLVSHRFQHSNFTDFTVIALCCSSKFTLESCRIFRSQRRINHAAHIPNNNLHTLVYDIYCIIIIISKYVRIQLAIHDSDRSFERKNRAFVDAAAEPHFAAHDTIVSPLNISDRLRPLRFQPLVDQHICSSNSRQRKRKLYAGYSLNIIMHMQKHRRIVCALIQVSM